MLFSEISDRSYPLYAVLLTVCLLATLGHLARQSQRTGAPAGAA